MGTFTVTFATANPVNTVYSRAFTISDADLGRILAGYQSVVNAQLGSTATPQQVAAYLTQQWINEMSNQVTGTLNAAAYAAAAAAVVPAPPVVAT